MNHRTKVNWAAHRLRELSDRVIEWFGSGNHHNHRIEPDPDYADRTLLVVEADPIPDIPFAVLVGDVVHNIRSSLDHLVYALSADQSGPLNENMARSCQFPIIGSEDLQKKPGPRKGLQHVNPAVQEFVEDLQPARLGDDYTTHPLWRLNWLANVDKHRTLHVSSAFAVNYSVSNCIVEGTFSGAFTMVEGSAVVAKLGRLRSKNPCIPIEDLVSPRLDIAFSEGPFRGHLVVAELEEIREYVIRQVLMPADQLFSGRHGGAS